MPINLLDRGALDKSEFATKNRFLDLYGWMIRYRIEEGKFAIWTGVKWDNTKSIQPLYEDFMGQVVEAMHEARAQLIFDISECEVAEDRGMMRDTLEALEKYPAAVARRNHYEAVCRCIKEDPRIMTSVEDYDTNNWILNTPAGVIDLLTGLKRPALESDLITRVTKVSPVRTATPLWDLMWEKIVNDATPKAAERKAYIEYMQMRLGSMLVGGNPEQLAVLAYGPEGGNGKSTIFGAIVNLLGDYGQHASSDSFLFKPNRGDNRDDLVMMDGARMVIAGEPQAGACLDENIFKTMTGQDKIVAAAKYQKTRTIHPRWSIVLHTNNYMPIQNPGGAMWRRLEISPFLHVFSRDADRNVHIDDDLVAEYPGIMQWLLDGLEAWQKAGRKLEVPAVCQRAKKQYMDHADVVRAYLIANPDDWQQGEKVMARSLHEKFKPWTKKEERRAVNFKNFVDRLGAAQEELGYALTQDNRNVTWLLPA